MQEITKSRILGIIYRLTVTTIGLGVAVFLFENAHVANFWGLVFAAALLTLSNTFIKPVLTILSLPFVVLTLGLFYFVINGLVILFVAWLSSGFFYVGSLWTAIGVSIVVSIINFLFDMFYTSGDIVYVRRG